MDLLTRTGTRINGLSQSAGWLRPDQSFEVAGRRVTLLRMRINGEVREPDPSDADLLAETTQADLVGVTLEPSQPSDPPWVLGSELVFLGWSSSCGIQIQNKRVARAHCAIVRGGPGEYLVDLSGQNPWVGDEEISGAAALHDSQSLTIGSATFTVRLKPPSDRQAAGPPLVAQVFGREADPRVPPSIPPDLVPAESQSALLAWMMGMIQGSQGEVLRHQSEFQRDDAIAPRDPGG